VIIGHLAVSRLEEHYLDAAPVPVFVAGLFPDLLDKTLCQGLHLTTSGRMWGHTLVGLGLTSTLVGLIWGKRALRSWALGYVSHLLCDVGGFVPWLHPFVDYAFKPSSGLWITLQRFFSDPRRWGTEGALSLWAVATLLWPWSRNVLRNRQRTTVDVQGG
jgi:hypothetical protein